MSVVRINGGSSLKVGGQKLFPLLLSYTSPLKPLCIPSLPILFPPFPCLPFHSPGRKRNANDKTEANLVAEMDWTFFTHSQTLFLDAPRFFIFS